MNPESIKAKLRKEADFCAKDFNFLLPVYEALVKKETFGGRWNKAKEILVKRQ